VDEAAPSGRTHAAVIAGVRSSRSPRCHPIGSAHPSAPRSSVTASCGVVRGLGGRWWSRGCA